jgi:hypothetical protein
MFEDDIKIQLKTIKCCKMHMKFISHTFYTDKMLKSSNKQNQSLTHSIYINQNQSLKFTVQLKNSHTRARARAHAHRLTIPPPPPPTKHNFYETRNLKYSSYHV